MYKTVPRIPASTLRAMAPKAPNLEVPRPPMALIASALRGTLPFLNGLPRLRELFLGEGFTLRTRDLNIWAGHKLLWNTDSAIDLDDLNEK